MDELVKMSQNKEFLVMDVVAACVNIITSEKKRADLRSITRALWNIYEMNESSCETLLEALVLERRILKIKGKTEYFFEDARNFKDFTLRVIEGDGIVTTHAEKCLAGVERDKLHYDDFEKFLLETGEFKDAEEVKFGLLEDIIDKKVELENDGEENFWAPKSEEVTVNDEVSVNADCNVVTVNAAGDEVALNANGDEGTVNADVDDVNVTTNADEVTVNADGEEATVNADVNAVGEINVNTKGDEVTVNADGEEVAVNAVVDVTVNADGDEGALNATGDEVTLDSGDNNSKLEEIAPSEAEESLNVISSESENLLIPSSASDKLEEVPSAEISYSEVSSGLEELPEKSLSGSLNSKGTTPPGSENLEEVPSLGSENSEEVLPSESENLEEVLPSESENLDEVLPSVSENMEEISEISIKSSDIATTSVETSTKNSSVSPCQIKSTEGSSDLGLEDNEREPSTKKMKISVSDEKSSELKAVEINVQMKTDPKAVKIKKEKCEDKPYDEYQGVEAKCVDVKPDVAHVKIKEEPASDDESQNSSRSSRSSRQRSRGYSDLPPKKSSRVSNKKFDDDYYFPSLKRKTISRRKKIGSPEPAEIKKEHGVKKLRLQVRQNPGTKCPICKTVCKVNDIPIRCISCRVTGHPACVEQEQMLYLNADQFDRMNWTCEDCRDSPPETDKMITNATKCSSCGGTQKFHESECSQCSSTKEVEDKKCGAERGDRGDMRSDMVVIHGLKSTTPVHLIWSEIAKRGFNPTRVANALSKNKDPLDMFFVVIPNLASDSKIYRISRLFNRDVKILRPYQLKKKSSDVGRLNEPDYDVAEENVPDLVTLPSSITIVKRKKKFRKIDNNDLCKYSVKQEVTCEPVHSSTPGAEILQVPNKNKLEAVESNEDKKPEVVKSTPKSPQRPEIMEPDSSSNITHVEKPLTDSKEERSVVLIPGRKEWKFPPRWVNRLNRPVPDPEVPDCISWTTEQVADYFATYFNDEDIDGYALKLLTRGNVLVEFGLNLGLALRVLFHVKRLQIRTNDRALIYMDES